jgi:drug/metabolite transporter (DMT)-like permease
MGRNILFVLQAFLTAGLQFYLPLGILHTLAVAGPIFVYVWQYIIERKKPHYKEYMAIILTVFGIVLTANGNIFLKWVDPTFEFAS